MNCFSDLKIFENSQSLASNFKRFSQTLEYFFLTIGQNNFGNKIPLFIFVFSGEMTSWCPNKEDLLHLQATCPNIKSLKLLMNDKDIYDLAKILEEDCIDFDICQLEIHHINPNFVSTGINRLCVTFANSLVSLVRFMSYSKCFYWG